MVVVPRTKPRNKPRPPEDVAYNRQVARERIVVEHTIRRVRCYQARHPDRPCIPRLDERRRPLT